MGVNMSSKQYKLISRIIFNSEADNWSEAVKEWFLDSVERVELGHTCTCGYYPIIEVNYIKNKLNGIVMKVGSCCVEKFIGIPSKKITHSHEKVKKDKTLSLNPSSLEQAKIAGKINDWEHDFYLDIWRKRNLSKKQIEKKVQINDKILQRN